MSILRCIRVRKIELDTKCNIAEVALELKQRYVDLYGEQGAEVANEGFDAAGGCNWYSLCCV
ncbi:hypothetical protein MTR_5g060430 [Medicago truncatula]|uniref:Uncharacterized protein n=1 Tax=Medicago truncatula TaxID=3880 RepID=G7K9W6_MEDTR|nr:hypothetical protein MTR_5g060430 [Medicago truncatula]